MKRSFLLLASLFAVLTAALANDSTYLNFTAVNGPATVKLDSIGTPYAINLQYSTDSTTWNTYTIGNTINLASGAKVYFKALDTNSVFCKDYKNFYRFVMSGRVSADGNIMSLLDATMTQNSVPSSAFSDLFAYCTSMTQAPALPATTLAINCYYEMFDSCVALTSAPALPATVLSDSCYKGMFQNCNSLITAPVLPATIMAYGCYSNMFLCCRSLTTAPALPATTLAPHCYYCMFSSCPSLTTAPSALPADSLTTACYAGMFGGCIALTTPPDLPANTLADYCYARMFIHCRALDTLPSLPATTLADSCYFEMFDSCVTLGLYSQSPGIQWSIPATSTASGALTNMFINTAGTMNGTPSANTTYYLTNRNARYTITANSNDTVMGTVAGGGVYKERVSATLTATAKTHYHFVSWSNGATTTTIIVTAFGDSTLIATFAPDPHTVTVLSNDTTMGSVSGGGTFNYGQTITLIATANANYHLVNWSNGATTDTITITLAGDTTLTANFAITQYAVTVACNNSSMGYVTGGGAFNYGDTAILIATAKPNYRFVSWSNGALTDTITVIVKGDTTLTANFVVDYGHSVVVNSNDSSADVYFYCQQMYDTIQVREYHLVIYKVGGNDTANVYFSSDTSFMMNRKPRVIVIVDSVSGTTTTVTISINHATFNPAVNQVAVHLENIAPNSTYSLYLEALGAMRVVLDHDSCTLTTPEFTSVPDVYDDEKVDDFFPTDQTDVYTIDGHYIGKYYLDLPPGIYLMREKGRWHKFGKVR